MVVKKIVIMAILLEATQVFGKVPKSIEWFHQAKQELPASIHRRYLFLEEKGGEWVPVPTDERGLMFIVGADYLEFYSRFTGDKKVAKTPQWMQDAFNRLPVDRIGFLSDDMLEIFWNDKGKIVRKRIKPKGGITWDKGNWFRSYLKYDGVVLARKNAFLLIESFNPLTSDSQALTLKDSQNLFRVNDKSSKGNALIQLVGHEGYIGVFEVVVSEGDEKILPGTKVLLGTKN